MSNLLSTTTGDFEARLWAVVPAAGRGTRFGGAVPKQHLPLGGQTVLACTMARLSTSLVLAGGVLVCAPEAAQTWPLTLPAGFWTCPGGAARQDSVLAGLDALQQVAHPNDWVLVHDAARPCVHPDSLRALVEALRHDPVGGILALPVRDTLKKSTSAHTVAHTVDRDHLWQAQTPQMFRFGLLRAALLDAKGQQWALTDEASAMERCGHAVCLIAGRSDNLKITHADDLPLAELIWQSQQHTQPKPVRG